MNKEHKTQNRNWVESMNEYRTWIKISVNVRRWTQNLNRDQESERKALVEFKKVKVFKWVESAVMKKMEDRKFFAGWV
jgi:hypothetical protein